MQNGREPLDFKMLQKKRSMSRLIERLRFADFARPEPNPFRILDRIKEEYGPDVIRDEKEGKKRAGSEDDDPDEDSDEDADDDDDDDDEEDGQGYGFFDYLSSCSVM